MLERPRNHPHHNQITPQIPSRREHSSRSDDGSNNQTKVYGEGAAIFDQVWKVGLLVILAAGVGGYLLQARHTVVPLSAGLILEYDRFTGRTRVGEVEVQSIGMTGRDSGRVVWLPTSAR
jgi:hypothetical protein